MQIFLNSDVEIESHAPALGPTGNAYQAVIAAGISWDEAKLAAEQRTFAGQPGHLATIISQAEDVFIEELRLDALAEAGFPGPQEFWVGGFQDPDQPTPRDGWHWVNGEGDIPGTNAGPGYANWFTNEPNDFPSPAEDNEENHLGIGLFGSGLGWNDDDHLNNILGYVVEFEVDADEFTNDTLETGQAV